MSSQLPESDRSVIQIHAELLKQAERFRSATWHQKYCRKTVVKGAYHPEEKFVLQSQFVVGLAPESNNLVWFTEIQTGYSSDSMESKFRYAWKKLKNR